jgi:hypothetical protein
MKHDAMQIARRHAHAMVSGVYCTINERIFALTALDVVYNSASARSNLYTMAHVHTLAVSQAEALPVR